MRFFRIQQKGIKFEDMMNFDSGDGGDGQAEGLTVSGRPDGHDGGSKFGGAWETYGDDEAEVIVLDGRVIAKIYDGYRIRPTREITRFSKGQWREMLETEEAWDYE